MTIDQNVKRLLLLLCGVCLSVLSFAQTISGKITDDAGNPLVGASIRNTTTQVTTTSNDNGEFTLQAALTEKIEISFVGFSPITITAGNRFHSITLQKSADNSLSDVVVVGYSTQKRASISGSVSVIGKKSLENRPVVNAVQALQGLSPGLVITRSSGQPGREGWNVNVRGTSSLNGTNSPLVMVDGVEYPNLTLINPDDIESISVLKDASAAAIYGAKASNGVLMVTTKSGKSGKVTVNYTMMAQSKKPISLPQTVPFHISAEIQNLANINNGGSPSFTDEQIAWFKDPNVTLVPDDPRNTFYYKEMNYVDMTIKKRVGAVNHNASISGGNETTRYFVGLGYTDNKGMFTIGPDGNKRYNARINFTTKLNKILSLDSRISYTQNKIESPSGTLEGDYGLLYNIYNLRPIYPIFVPGDESKLVSGVNTYATLKEGGYNNINDNLFDAVFTLKATNIVDGLTLSATYSPHYQQTNQNIFNKTVPLYSFVKATGTFQQNSWVNRSNSLYKYRTTQVSYTTNLLAEYDKSFGDHNFRALGGFQYQSYDFDRTNTAQTNLINNNLPTLNYTTNATLPVTALSDNLQANTWVSYFGRINYDFANKYFLEGTLRQDASSRLAPGHRSQLFPAVSAAWRISQEKWFGDSRLINELKIRGSWGKLGNAQLGQLYENNYLSTPLLINGVYPFNNAATTYIYQRDLPSEGLGWETVTTSELGLDFSLLKGKLSGSFSVYKRVNDNMLIPVNLPATLGVTPSTANAAAMETKGWDLELSWKDRIGAFQYFVSANLSDNQNKITKYLGNIVYTEGLNAALPGMPINSIFGYRSLGYFQSAEDVLKSAKQFGTTNQAPGDIRYQDVNGDGVINGGVGTPENHGDLVYLGNTAPRYNFGLNLGAQWKGFDLSVFLQGVGRRYYMMYPYQVIPYMQSWRYPLDNYPGNYWTEDNRDARFPRPIAGGGTNTRINSAFVQNGAYVRLKNIQLGYTIPENLTRSVKIQRARVFVSGQDVWTSTKAWYKYFDPESPNNVSYSYPFFATWALGLNITF
ncbi:MAG: TonB-dependent receptor [Flavipsychrobacter sp.]|nr:TonB-dependent receptor [Flavipsychrobacter sp.]